MAAAPAAGIEAWTNVGAVLELPLGEPEVDFGALYRGMTHRVPTVNGVSGYLAPHILPLAQALRDRQYSAFYQLSSAGPIGVALDRTRRGAGDLEAELRAAGLVPGPSHDGWAGLIVPSRRRVVVALGQPLPLSTVSASVHGENAARMLDRDLRTAWGTEGSQSAVKR